MGGINFTPGANQQYMNAGIKAGNAQAAQESIPGGNTIGNPGNAVNKFIEQSTKSLSQFFANAQSAQMSGRDMSSVLKDLMSMQKDIQAFLAEATGGNTTTAMPKAELAKLMLGSTMDLSKLITFMQQNGKEAIANLFKMTANFSQSGAVARPAQTSEIAAIINACTQGLEGNQAQAVKNLMLLYLPWLPLGADNDFSLEFGSGSGGEEGKEDEDFVNVMISTKNFGNIGIFIFKVDSTSVSFTIKAAENFPREEVEGKIKNEAKDYSVNTSFEFQKKEKLKAPDKTTPIKTEVSVNTSNRINPFLLLMAQSAIKITVETDKTYSLRDSRKTML